MGINVVSKRLRSYNGTYDVYVGRPSPLGNPFKPTKRGIGETLEKYEEWLKLQIERMLPAYNELERIRRLSAEADVNLVCWCAPSPCHADVIKRCIDEEWM